MIIWISIIVIIVLIWYYYRQKENYWTCTDCQGWTIYGATGLPTEPNGIRSYDYPTGNTFREFKSCGKRRGDLGELNNGLRAQPSSNGYTPFLVNPFTIPDSIGKCPQRQGADIDSTIYNNAFIGQSGINNSKLAELVIPPNTSRFFTITENDQEPKTS